MAEIQLQLGEQKTLKALSGTTEPVRASDLTEDIGETALNIGNSLRELGKRALAELVDKNKKLWRITDSGRELATTIQLPALELKPPAAAPAPAPAAAPAPAPAATPVPAETPPATQTPAQPAGPAFPSQAEILKMDGELLAVGTRKGDISLEVIVKYVERMANLNDLGSISNALTEMGVDTATKKRWLKLYAQDLREKMTGEETSYQELKDLRFDTGFTIAEWREASRQGNVCGILGCTDKPVTKCSHCGNHYCRKHEIVLQTIAHKRGYK